MIKAINMPKDSSELKVDDLKVEIYWATCKRFFTYSRIEREKIIVEGNRSVVVKLYEFIGVFDFFDIQDQVLSLHLTPKLFTTWLLIP
ncbi:MAG: hypothetical protein QXV57_08845 [Thermoproteota archaeon]